MKKSDKARFSNAILTMMVAVSILTIFWPIGISGQIGQPYDPTSYGMTSGRLAATVGAVVGLVGVIIGGLALARPSSRFGTGSGRLGAIVALVAGMMGMALGAWVYSVSGSIGTGGGLAGAIVALVMGLLAITLSGLALARWRGTA